MWKDLPAPKLVDYKMLLATSDKYGQVLKGSYIILEGLWKRMYTYNPVPKEPKKQKAYSPSPSPISDEHDGSFTIRLDHPSRLQEKHTWVGTETTPGSQVLLLLSASRLLVSEYLGSPLSEGYGCLILKYVGNDCRERDRCCILPGEECPSNTSYSGWAKCKFKLV
jgi:hypothetical protein